jgi:hypothetical protein
MRVASTFSGLLVGLLGPALLMTTCAQPTGITDGGSDAAPDLARPPGDSLPRDAVSFFRRDTCPVGWVPLGTAVGRFLVPTLGSVGGGTFAGTPLASGEDRQHSHTFQASVTPRTTSFAGLSGSNTNIAQAGAVAIDGTMQPASSGLPYVQLLACQKSTEPLRDLPPPPSGMMVFFANTTTCPSGWAQAAVTQGRMLVGLPNQGGAGLPFGGNALGSLEQRSHTHPVNGTLATVSYGIALAGDSGTDFAAHGSYTFSVTSSSTPADLPYLQLLHCQKN